MEGNQMAWKSGALATTLAVAVVLLSSHRVTTVVRGKLVSEGGGVTFLIRPRIEPENVGDEFPAVNADAYVVFLEGNCEQKECRIVKKDRVWLLMITEAETFREMNKTLSDLEESNGLIDELGSLFKLDLARRKRVELDEKVRETQRRRSNGSMLEAPGDSKQ
jgi:hypothetical protein